VKWKLTSLTSLFPCLLFLIFLDILTTNPSFESNPFTLYVWAQVGVFLSIWVKVGQVLFLGVLFVSVKKVAKPAEWPFAQKILQATLLVLVSFYVFVVTWNLFTHLIRFLSL
jgi:hypothetical protein